MPLAANTNTEVAIVSAHWHQQRRRRTVLGLTGLPLVGVSPASAQSAAGPTFPNQTISIVVPFAAGGIADLTTRVMAQAMVTGLGVPVVVENKPSAGSIVASQQVARAKADGHTLLLMSNSHAVSKSLFRQLPFDSQKDFAPVGLIGAFELGLFVGPTSPYRSLRAVLEDARARPGKLNIGTVAIGSTQHLCAELLKHAADIDAVVVPYKGSPAVITALRSGEIDLAIEILGPVLPQLQSGALRALALTGAQQNPALPGVATVSDSGVPGFEVESWNGLAAPAGTPPAVVERINRSAREALESTAVRERLARLGVRPMPGSPEQMQVLLARETLRWADVIRRSGIQPQ